MERLGYDSWRAVSKISFMESKGDMIHGESEEYDSWGVRGILL